MCEPISATTMMYMSIASAAISAYATNQTAKAQKQQITTQQANEREEAYETAEEELGQRIRQSRERRARARVAAGESGALGASFAASINQSLVDQNMDAALVAKQAAFTQRGIDDRANLALSQVRDPSALEAGLQIATAGMRGYAMGAQPTADKLTDAIPQGAMSPVSNPPPTKLWNGTPQGPMSPVSNPPPTKLWNG